MNNLSAFRELFPNFEKTLSLCSDGFFPFTDSIEEGLKKGLRRI